MAKNHSHPSGWQRFLAGTLATINEANNQYNTPLFIFWSKLSNRHLRGYRWGMEHESL